MTEIWTSNWVFYFKKEHAEYVVKDVITKKIPVRFLLNEDESYARAIRDIQPKILSELENDPKTGLKKFKIIYTKKIGEVNDEKKGN